MGAVNHRATNMLGPEIMEQKLGMRPDLLGWHQQAIFPTMSCGVGRQGGMEGGTWGPGNLLYGSHEGQEVK